MKLGIDFGTTRIVVAAVDRGNYPLVHFETPDGVYDEWFPSLVSLRPANGSLNGSMQHAERRYGWDAWQGQSEPGWVNIRSIKRYLEHAGPETRLSLHGAQVPITQLLGGLLSSLRSALAAQFGAKEPFEAMLGVPANANTNQRFLTVDAFRRAGFSVLGLLNEPSAASIEFGHRQKSKGRILVYDLGGGTFDVSLVSMADGTHTVLASEGISNLGGDDFDIVLAELAAGREVLHSLTLAEMFRLDEECRRQKEALHPNSRKIVIDLDVAREGLGQAVVPVAEFYQHCRPLLDESLALALKLARGENIEALYVTGGGSELPLVTRLLREEFGRKVTRSEYTRSATAIGLAIQADSASGYRLREMFTRDFGVWREGQGGERMIFDPIFLRGTRLPSAGDPPLAVNRVYRPVHNIGDFRYIEASHLGNQGEPAGDIAVWDEILFPFDPALRHTTSLEGLPVTRSQAVAAEEIEESYACDAAGVVKVTIRNLTSSYSREFSLGRWSGKAAVVALSGGKRVRRAAT